MTFFLNAEKERCSSWTLSLVLYLSIGFSSPARYILTTPFSTAIAQFTHWVKKLEKILIVETKSCQLVLQKTGSRVASSKAFGFTTRSYQDAYQGRTCGRRSHINHETRHVTGLKDLDTLKLSNLGYKRFLRLTLFTING